MKKNKAYTLIELSISLAVLAIIFTGLIGVFLKKDEGERYKITNDRIAVINKAIADYVDSNYFLPCPAQGNTLETSSAFGYSVTYSSPTCDNTNLDNYVGMVPVRTLNLPDFYAYDGWGRKFSFSIASGMGGKADVTSNQYPGDIKVIDLNGTSKTMMSHNYPNNYGAAYVLISYGRSGTGAWLKNSTASRTLPSSSSREYINANYSPYKKFIQSSRSYIFDQIVAYRALPDLLNMKYQNSPLRIPLSTCSNASTILNDPSLTYNNTTTAVSGVNVKSIISQTASAISNLCNNQPTQSLKSASICGFTPTKLSGVQLWFDANDPNNTGVTPSNGAAISTWKDKSGAGNDATRQNGSPVYNTSSPFQKGAIYIPATATGIGNFSFNLSFLTNADFSFFIVHTSSPSLSYNASYNYSWIFGDTNLKIAFGPNMYDANNQNKFVWKYLWWINNSIYFGVPTNELLISKYNATNANILTMHLPFLISGVSNSTIPQTSLTHRSTNGYSNTKYLNAAYSLSGIGTGYLAINSGTNASNSYTGYIAEVIIYNRALTITESKMVEGYLLRKWFSGEC